MFGGGFGSSGFGNTQQPQQQQSIFGAQTPATPFGGFGTPTPQQQQPPAFGQTQPQGFGTPAQSSIGGFGASTTTAPSAFASQSRPAFGAGGSIFGSSTPATGTATGWGQPPASSTTTFGGQTGTASIFGATPSASTGFGFGSSASTNTFGGAGQQTMGAFSSATTPAQSAYPPQGTATFPFAPHQERDGAGALSVLNTYQNISAMPQYKNWSVEELRLADYQQGRKSSTTQSGFGQPSAFGAPSSFGSNVNQQAPSIFGNAASSAPAMGGLFGQPQAQAGAFSGGFGGASTGGFGSTANAFGARPAGTGMFGTTPATQSPFATTTQPPATGFGAPAAANTGFGSTTPAFGSSTFAANKPSAFGGFGTATATSAPAFGAATTAPSPFGTSTTPAFGTPQQPVAGGFGTVTSTPFTGFGAPQAAQPAPSSFGGFGSGLANKPATNAFSFGGPAAQPAGTLGAKPGGFGFGAAPPTSGFGTPASAATTGLFGQTSQAPTGGLFAGTSQPGQGLFGGNTLAAPAATGLGTTSFFNSKPAGSLFPAATTTPSLNLGGTQNAATTFGLGGSTAMGAPGALGTSSMAAPGATGPLLQASINQNAYGQNPLFSTPSRPKANIGPVATPVQAATPGGDLNIRPAAKRTGALLANYKITPKSASKIKLRGFTSSTATTASPSSSPSAKSYHLFDGQSDDQYLSPDTFVPRRSVKKLVIEQQPTLSNAIARGSMSKSLYPSTHANDRIRSSIEPSLEIEAEQSNRDRANEAFAKATSMSHMTPPRRGMTSPISRLSPSPTASSGDTVDGTPSRSPSQSPPKGTYWTSPAISHLRKLPQDQLRAVKNFRVGRIGYGQVTFLDTVDLTEVTEGLEAILGEIVTFEKRVCTVYPDDDTKPEVGHGLNVPAVISLEECWFVDKATREVVKDSSDFRAQRQLNRLRNHRDTEFIEFLDDAGTWVFRVEHFSRYGLDDDEENEIVEPSPATTSSQNRIVETRTQNRNQVAFFSQPSEAQRSVPARLSAEQDVDAPIGRDLYAEEGNDGEEDGFADDVNEETAGEEMVLELDENMESDHQFHRDDFMEDDGEAEADSDSDILLEQMDGREDEQDSYLYPVAPTVAPAARPWAQQLGLTARNVQVKQASLFCSTYTPKQSKFETSGFQGGFGDSDTGVESQFFSKRPISISDDSQSDDSDAQVPVSHYAPPPKLRPRPPRKFARVGYESSILFDKSREFAEPGLMMNRSFRVGWGPGGKIVHCGQICGWKDLFDQNQGNHVGSDDTVTKANVCLEDICIFGQSEDLERERHSITLRAQLEKCKIDGDRHAVPGVSVFRDASFDHFVRAVEGSSEDVFDNAERLLWSLGAALWDVIPLAEEFAALSVPQQHSVEAIARKDAVGNWLQNAVQNSALRDVEKLVATGSETAAAKAFFYLTAHMVGPACVAAKDGKDFRLATLIAQEGTDETSRELVAGQIKRWNELRVMPHIPLPHRRLYELLSGNTELATVHTEDGQTKRFHVAEKLDWKRCFGLNFWYGLRPHEPLQECLKEYDASWTQSTQAEPDFRVAPPVPWYVENARTLSTDVDEQPRDMFWELLHLAVDPGRPLDSSCLPCGITPHLLNYRFAWLLHCVLGRSLGKRNFRDAEQNVASNLAESVTASLAFQLEHLGMWEWAIFVRMHHFDSESRTIAIQHLLCRNVPSASEFEEFDEEETSDWNETKKFLLERLLIPQIWIHEAKALRARYENQVYDETMALLDAGHYNAAHKLIVLVLAPDLIISGNHNELRKLLGRVDPLEVKDWHAEGEMYLEYIGCMEETPSLVFQAAASRQELPHVISEVQKRLGNLLDLLGKASSEPTQVLPFGRSSSTKLRRTRSVCLAEMATNVSKLLQTVEPLCRAGPSGPENDIMFGSLPLPEDQRLNRLHQLTNNYFNHLASYDEIAAK